MKHHRRPPLKREIIVDGRVAFPVAAFLVDLHAEEYAAKVSSWFVRHEPRAILPHRVYQWEDEPTTTDKVVSVRPA